MNPSDLVVICAESLPFKQALDLIIWYVRGDYKEAIAHPSYRWWVERHAAEVSYTFYNGRGKP